MADMYLIDLTVETKEGNTNTYELVQPDGYYQEMTVGDAEQLVATVGVTDKVPYLFRTSGGSADIGNRETDEITGGSLVWNQNVVNGGMSAQGSFGYGGGTIAISDGTLKYTFTTVYNNAYSNQIYQPLTPKVVAGHVIFIGTSIKPAHTCNIQAWLIASSGNNNYNQGWRIGNAVANQWNRVERVIKRTANDGANRLQVCIENASTAGFAVGELVEFDNIVLYDLTQMFGSTIADYIYSLEQAAAGAGVAWFKKLFPKDYYAYNAGELLSVSGVSAHRMVGFNAYNPETGTAVLLGGNQYQITGAYTALSYTDIGGNAETITPDSNGLFTPAANGTLTITGGNSTDTCVHLVWSGTHNGEYEPYEVHEYALDDSLTLRGIPKLDANNELYYDGDTYESDGTVTRYWTERAYQEGDVSDGSTMITDGTTTVYKLATPTTETAEPYTAIQVVNDWGTEEYVTDSIVPVGHTTTYGANLRDKLQHLPDLADNDGYYLIQQTGTQMALVPFRIPQATGADGTYVLKATVSGGTPTYTWVLEE